MEGENTGRTAANTTDATTATYIYSAVLRHRSQVETAVLTIFV
jgi:hypothetical protein